MWCCNLIILVLVAILLRETVAQDDPPVKIDDAAEATITDLPDIDEKNIPGINAPLPTRQELIRMLDSLTGLSDEDKENLRNDLLKSIEEEPTDTNNPSKLNNFPTQALMLFTLLGLLALIFVFFVNKLHKSMTLKERQIEEKRRMKKLKKNK